MFEIKVDSKEVTKFFQDVQQGFEDDNISRILNEAASYLDFKILERTSKGVDVDSAPFKAYSQMSVRLRREAGLPTDKPDLFFTGQMLNAMTHESTPEIGRVFFMGGSSPSPTEKMLKNNPIRPFFGISEEDNFFVQNLVDDEVDKIINGK